jgi:hypothetical protein
VPLRSIVRSALRHRVALVAIALVTASTAAGFWMSSPPSYEVSGSYWILPPGADVGDDSTNPLALAGTDANGVVAEALALRVNGDAARRDIERRGLAGSYAIGPVSDGSPILELRVRSGDDRVAAASANAIEVLVAEELSATQDDLGATSAGRFELGTLDVSFPTPDHAERNRLVGATLLVGLLAAPVLAITLELMAESVAERRRVALHPSRTGRQRAASAVVVRTTASAQRSA